MSIVSKDYLTIQKWMLSLNLNPNELLLYALVYSFSQDGKSTMYGRISYLQRWIKSESTIKLNLKSLIEKGFVAKRKDEKGTIHLNAILSRIPETTEKGEINIQGWMVSELNLKSTELLIYALIYGFSRDGNSWYCGSYNYISKWTGLKKLAIISNINSLTNSGLIIKNESTDNIQSNQYRANLQKLGSMNSNPKGSMNSNGGSMDSNWGSMNSNWGSMNSNPEGSMDSNSKVVCFLTCNNNILDNISNNNILNNIKDNKKKPQLKIEGECFEIIDYLNLVSGRKLTTEAHYKHLKKFLKKYSVGDAKKIIDLKFAEWKGSEMMKYFRPETLFVSKVDYYMEQVKEIEQRPELLKMYVKEKSNVEIARDLTRLYAERNNERIEAKMAALKRVREMQ